MSSAHTYIRRTGAAPAYSELKVLCIADLPTAVKLMSVCDFSSVFVSLLYLHIHNQDIFIPFEEYPFRDSNSEKLDFESSVYASSTKGA